MFLTKELNISARPVIMPIHPPHVSNADGYGCPFDPVCQFLGGSMKLGLVSQQALQRAQEAHEAQDFHDKKVQGKVVNEDIKAAPIDVVGA